MEMERTNRGVLFKLRANRALEQPGSPPASAFVGPSGQCIPKALTTQQAADILNVSRQYLVRLLENKEIPFTRMGKHRHLRMDHVIEYKERRDLKRRRQLREISRIAQDARGYPEFGSQDG